MNDATRAPGIRWNHSVRRRPATVVIARSVVVSMIAALVPVVIDAPPVAAHTTGAYSHAASLGNRGPWMERLPDDATLGALSIPGTHDSAAFQDFLTSFAQTQSMSIPDQLAAGIRAFDIRLALDGDNNFTVVHGTADLLVDLEDHILDVIEQFLIENPSEVVFLRVKQEQTENSNFVTAVDQKLLDELKDGMVSLIADGADGSTPIGDVRGKVVFVNPEGDSNTSVPSYQDEIDYEYYQDESDACSKEKWPHIRDFHDSIESVTSYQIQLNFLSSNGISNSSCAGDLPYFVASGHINEGTDAARRSTGYVANCSDQDQDLTADDWNGCPGYFPKVECAGRLCTVAYEGMNVLFAQYLNDDDDVYLDRAGIVFADFPGASLITAIIDQNPPPPDLPEVKCGIYRPTDFQSEQVDGFPEYCHDGDGVVYKDNCYGFPNPSQLDTDGDEIGDAWGTLDAFCDSDWDGDGTTNRDDRCPLSPSLFLCTSGGNDDFDDDGFRDRGLHSDEDNCVAPLLEAPTQEYYNPLQQNLDGDAYGDICDDDIDADGVPNKRLGLGNSATDVLFANHGSGFDNCPFVPNKQQENSDNFDLVVGERDFGDACDLDDDNDGVFDDTYDDRIGVPLDNCRTTFNPDQSDINADGEGDVCDDTDVDLVVDFHDNCPFVHNPDQADTDGDGLGDACDRIVLVVSRTSISEGSTFFLTAVVDNGVGVPPIEGYRWDTDFDGIAEADLNFQPRVTVFARDNDAAPVAFWFEDGGQVERVYIPVSNRPPAISPRLPATIYAQASVELTLDVAFTDAGRLDTHTYRVSWGDGTEDRSTAPTSAKVVRPAHVYSAPGDYAVQICIIDKDRGEDCDTTTVSVGRLTVTEPAIVDEGSSARISATYALPPTTGSFEAFVREADGSKVGTTSIVPGTPFTLSYPVADDGTEVATVCVQFFAAPAAAAVDVACESTNVTGRNVAPTIGPLPTRIPVRVGEEVTVEFVFTDPGTMDTHTYGVAWGDGPPDPPTAASAGATTRATHTYTRGGDYRVTICVVDDDFGRGCEDTIVSVASLTLLAPAAVDEGSSASITATYTDGGAGPFTGFIRTAAGGRVGESTITSGTPFVLSYPVAQDGSHPVEICASSPTVTTCQSTTVVGNNVAPTVTLDPIATVDEGVVTTVTGRFTDPGTLDPHTATIDWGSGPVNLTLAADDTFSATNPNPDNRSYTVSICVTDDDTTTCESGGASVQNVAPTVTLATIPDTTWGAVTSVSATYTDPGTGDTHTAEIQWGDSAVDVVSPATSPIAGTHTYTSPGDKTVTVCVTDDDGGEGCKQAVARVLDPPPTVTLSRQSVDGTYSDGIVPVEIDMADVGPDAITVSSEWNAVGGPQASGLPLGLSHVVTCDPIDGCSTLTVTLSGNVEVPEGNYEIHYTGTDRAGQATSSTIMLMVAAEDATVGVVANPVAFSVDGTDGDLDVLGLSFAVQEVSPDAAAADGLAQPGDISKARVKATLVPVGPGTPVAGTCANGSVDGTGYDAVLTVGCAFPDVPVNAYSVEFEIVGGYYQGSGEDLVAVSDPGAGFTTGGGWFYWPGTADESSGYRGDRTNFGFTMKYGRNGSNLKGNLVVIRHLVDGSIHRLKSNVLDSLSVGGVQNAGWAVFTGKATYALPNQDPVGSHSFRAYVEDNGEPGRADRFWISVTDKNRTEVPGLSLAAPANLNAEDLLGGNIQVPQGARR